MRGARALIRRAGWTTRRRAGRSSRRRSRPGDGAAVRQRHRRGRVHLQPRKLHCDGNLHDAVRAKGENSCSSLARFSPSNSSPQCLSNPCYAGCLVCADQTFYGSCSVAQSWSFGLSRHFPGLYLSGSSTTCSEAVYFANNTLLTVSGTGAWFGRAHAAFRRRTSARLTHPRPAGQLYTSSATSGTGVAGQTISALGSGGVCSSFAGTPAASAVRPQCATITASMMPSYSSTGYTSVDLSLTGAPPFLLVSRFPPPFHFFLPPPPTPLPFLHAHPPSLLQAFTTTPPPPPRAARPQPPAPRTAVWCAPTAQRSRYTVRRARPRCFPSPPAPSPPSPARRTRTTGCLSFRTAPSRRPRPPPRRPSTSLRRRRRPRRQNPPRRRRARTAPPSRRGSSPTTGARFPPASSSGRTALPFFVRSASSASSETRLLLSSLSRATDAPWRARLLLPGPTCRRSPRRGPT